MDLGDQQPRPVGHDQRDSGRANAGDVGGQQGVVARMVARQAGEDQFRGCRLGQGRAVFEPLEEGWGIRL
jgi:hypothetical protein